MGFKPTAILLRLPPPYQLYHYHIKVIVDLTVTHAAPNPVIFYAAISHFLVLRVRAE